MKPTQKSITSFEAALEQSFANIAAVEKQSFHLAFPGENARPGEVYMANEALFVEGNFNEPLTNYAVGWRDPNNIEAHLEILAPEVLTGRWFTYAEFANIEEFLADPNEDLRAVGADFPRVKYTSKKTPAKTLNRGLTIRVDTDELPNPLPANWEQRYVARLLRRIKRNSLLRAIALIDAASTNTGVTWKGATGENPDGAVRAMLLAGATALGFRGNTVIFGDTAWDARVTSHEAQNTPGGYAAAGRTPQMLAAYLGIDRADVLRERYSVAGAAKGEMVGSKVYSYFAESGADTEDASNIKRFVSPTQSGGPVRVFVQQVSAKLWDITVEHYELIKITSPLGMRKLTVALS